MATVRRLEELEVWKLARVQCKEIYALIQSGSYKNDWPLRDQMNRSSASVMDNIAEGFERFARLDFRHFLVMAKGSNGELRSQLHRMADRDFIDDAGYQRLVAANELLGKKLFAFINHLTTTSIKDKSGRPPGPHLLEEPGTFYNNLQEGYELPPDFLA